MLSTCLPWSCINQAVVIVTGWAVPLRFIVGRPSSAARGPLPTGFIIPFSRLKIRQIKKMTFLIYSNMSL
jgi:hypothetical protein